MARNLETFKAETVTFRRKQNHDLSKLLKALTKESELAILTLMELMKSQDENIKLRATTKFIEFQIDISDRISKDNLQRLLAEVKYGDPRTANLIKEDQEKEEDETPLIDFSTVQDV